MNADIDHSSEKDGPTEHNDTDPSNIGLSLTIREIAERLVISEEAARALVKLVTTEQSLLPCQTS